MVNSERKELGFEGLCLHNDRMIKGVERSNEDNESLVPLRASNKGVICQAHIVRGLDTGHAPKIGQCWPQTSGSTSACFQKLIMGMQEERIDYKRRSKRKNPAAKNHPRSV